jgi:hypothetical protein
LAALPNDALKSKYAGKGRRLPPNFADRVLELEMELERDCSSIESINSLLYLYSVSFPEIVLCLKIASSRIFQWNK